MNNCFINITKALNIKSSKKSNSNNIKELVSEFIDQLSIKIKRKLFTQYP